MDDEVLRALAERYRTPLAVYDQARMLGNAEWLRSALSAAGVEGRICFAFKAVGHQGLSRVFAKEGLGCEVMSADEFHLALGAGFRAQDMVLTGLGWSTEGIDALVGAGIGLVCVDNHSDLARVGASAKSVKRRQRVAIRVSPDEAEFAQVGSKLGMPLFDGQGADLARAAAATDGVAFIGVHAHFAHQCVDLDRWERCAQQVARFAASVRDLMDGPLALDLGGGLHDRRRLEAAGWSAEDFGAAVARVARICDPREIIVEPGRFLVGDAGCVLGSVTTDKAVRGPGGRTTRWIITDAASNLLVPIPSAGFEVRSLAGRSGPRAEMGVAGPICSPTSVIQTDALLPGATSFGDLLCVEYAGAYTLSLSEQWGMPLPPVVLCLSNGCELLVDRAERRRQFVAHAGASS